ncbi:hypothetical protein JCM14469_28280 [Desulfatiferula olefinivorans]
MDQVERTYRAILETIADGYYEVDLSGNLTFFNDSHAELHGCPREQLHGLNYRDYVVDEDVDKVFSAFNRVYETGKPLKRMEFAMYRQDNTRHHVECSISLIRNAAGEKVGFRGMARDVTDRKLDQEALRKSEERYRTILENVEEAYYEIDLQGNFTLVTDALSRNLGYSRDELLGMNYRAYMDEENASKVFTVYHDVFVQGDPQTLFQYEVIRKDGRRIVNEISISLIRDEQGRPTGFRGVGRDITRRKEVEIELQRARDQAEAASRAKSDFLANMSHEIRTPMNAVLGFTDLLLENPGDEAREEYLNIIKQNGEVLVGLLNDILDFSKIESGRLDFQELDFDPELVVYDVLDIVRSGIGTKPIELLCRIDDTVPPLISGDPLRFRQVITNILGNAVKYTPAGEVEITLSVEAVESDRLKLHAMIRDTGIGVPGDCRQSIFEAFHQLDNTSSQQYGGVGLGLAICRRIAGHLDGEVWVESGAPDDSGLPRGSRFHFTAWYTRVPDRVVARKPPISLRGKRILVVDGNGVSGDILCVMLRAAGMEAVASDRADGVTDRLTVAGAAGQPFDALLVDTGLPEAANGLLIERLQSAPAPFDRLTVIALSSSTERDALHCRDIGFDGFLSKPVRRDRLLQMLANLLGPAASESGSGTPRRSMATGYSIREDMKHAAAILLAEDNPANQKLTQTMLTKAGYRVDVVANGREAVSAVEAAPDRFDLILMDVQMPVIDGIEATRIIRMKGFTEVPIVALTAHALSGDREKCLAAGMNAYTTKPIKRDAVFQLLDQWVFSRDAGRLRGHGR